LNESVVNKSIVAHTAQARQFADRSPCLGTTQFTWFQRHRYKLFSFNLFLCYWIKFWYWNWKSLLINLVSRLLVIPLLIGFSGLLNRILITSINQLVSYGEIKPTWVGLVVLAWECVPPQSFRFDSLYCQFEGVSLTSSKKRLRWNFRL